MKQQELNKRMAEEEKSRQEARVEREKTRDADRRDHDRRDRDKDTVWHFLSPLNTCTSHLKLHHNVLCETQLPPHRFPLPHADQWTSARTLTWV